MFWNSCCYGMSCCLLQRFTADVLFFSAPFVTAAVWVTRYQVDNKLLNTWAIETFAFPVLIHYFSHMFKAFGSIVTCAITDGLALKVFKVSMRLKIVLRSFTKLFRFDHTISMGFYQQWYGRSRMTLYSYSHSAWSCEKTNIVLVNFSQKTTLRQSNIGHILLSKEISNHHTPICKKPYSSIQQICKVQ